MLRACRTMVTCVEHSTSTVYLFVGKSITEIYVYEHNKHENELAGQVPEKS